jgi:hypothetical protein
MRDLASDRAMTRDAAVARLTVIGARAVSRLEAMAADAAAAAGARIAALRTIEAIADPRALDSVIAAMRSEEASVAMAAIGMARAFFGTPRGVEAVDHVTALALDATRLGELRRAAVVALADLPASTVAPVFKTLAGDTNAHVARTAAELSAPATKRATARRDPLARWTGADALNDPEGLRRALLAENGAGVPLTTLLALVQKLREREESERPGRRASWTTARAAAHATLAARGSRVALYDLKETLEAANEPLPVEFLTALSLIGDTSCLEAIAAAYAKAVKKRTDEWWRRRLLDAFHEIVRREKLSARHAVMKRVQQRWPQVLGVRE